jgi:hypothetical protein
VPLRFAAQRVVPIRRGRGAAIVTAVNYSASHGGSSPALLLHGFRAAAAVSVVASHVGVAAMVARRPAWVSMDKRERSVEAALAARRRRKGEIWPSLETHPWWRPAGSAEVFGASPAHEIGG